MAKAGYCSKCGGYAWLNESGGCVAGHGAECVTGVYEAAAPPTQVAAPARRSGAPIMAIVLVLMVPVALMMCGILVAIAIPVFNSAKVNAQQRACYANERVIEGALMSYLAAHDGTPPPTDIVGLTNQIVPSVITSMPACPVGGTYRWVSVPGSPAGGRVECSIHGSFETSQQ